MISLRTAIGYLLGAGLFVYGLNHAVGAEIVSPAIPFKQASPVTDSGMAGLGGGLLLCLFAGGGAYFYLRKKNGISRPRGMKSKHLHVMESQRLGNGATLHVIEFAGELHLLAHTAQGIKHIARASDNATPPAEAEPGK